MQFYSTNQTVLVKVSILIAPNWDDFTATTFRNDVSISGGCFLLTLSVSNAGDLYFASEKHPFHFLKKYLKRKIEEKFCSATFFVQFHVLSSLL